MRLFMKEQYKTEIYVSDYGYIVINQDSHGYNNSVLLSPEQMKSLTQQFTENQKEIISAWDSLPEID